MHPDYINRPRRSPIMSLARRILRTEREMWILWELSLKGRVNSRAQDHQGLPPLVSYVRLLRRRTRLEQELNHYLP